VLTAVVTRGLAIEVNFVAVEEDGDGAEKMTFEESQEFCEFPYETESEFEKCGLTEEYLFGFKPPFVKESRLKARSDQRKGCWGKKKPPQNAGVLLWSKSDFTAGLHPRLPGL